MGTVVEDIKDKLDIAEVIKSYITISPAGKNFKACCPFHHEKTPSFMISPERRSWHCFGGCNEGGDVISFVMKYENIEFYDALKLLSERAGIDPSRLRGGAGEYRKYDALYAINEAAKDFFVASMTPHVREYALGRGLAPETLAEFGVGYALNEPDALLRVLTKRGFSVQDICEAGVVFRTERGTYWDRFRGRLMFPLFNHVGKVVGFTGRIMPDDPKAAELAKYVNSPETPIFMKSKVLYGFHATKSYVREAGAALLVEGQMDFLMAYQAGVRNVVATSGTALTGEHLETLRRLADTLLLCFDSDEAGQRAIERGIDLALAHDFSVKVVALTGKDPADIVQEDPQALARLVASAGSARDFYFNRYLPQSAGSAHDHEALKRGVRAVLVKAKALPSPFEQSAWLKELVVRTGMSEYVLQGEMDRLEAPHATPVPLRVPSPVPYGPKAAQAPVRASRKELIIARIVQLGGSPELASFAPEYAPPEASALSEMKASLDGGDIAPEERAKEIALLMVELEREWRKEKITVLKGAIIEAQAAKDEIRLASALREFDTFSRKLHTRVDDKTQK